MIRPPKRSGASWRALHERLQAREDHLEGSATAQVQVGELHGGPVAQLFLSRFQVGSRFLLPAQAQAAHATHEERAGVVGGTVGESGVRIVRVRPGVHVASLRRASAMPEANI